MKVNEMVFFDRLRNIKKSLNDAYMHVFSGVVPLKTIDDYKIFLAGFWESFDAVKEARDDLDLLLSLTMEDPQHIALQGQHNLKKPELYGLLGITQPVPRAPIGAVTGHPVAVKKPELKEKANGAEEGCTKTQLEKYHEELTQATKTRREATGQAWENYRKFTTKARKAYKEAEKK